MSPTERMLLRLDLVQQENSVVLARIVKSTKAVAVIIKNAAWLSILVGALQIFGQKIQHAADMRSNELMSDYLIDKSNKFCLRCPAFLKNGRHDFCDKCLAEAERAARKLQLVGDLDRANGRVREA